MGDIIVPEWGPAVLRYSIIGLVAPPALGKFLGYGTSVALFATLGIPFPELVVPIVGAVELGAVLLLLVDEARWVAALALLPVVVVAVWTAGEWQAVAVLVAVTGLLAIEFSGVDVDRTAPGPATAEDDTG